MPPPEFLNTKLALYLATMKLPNLRGLLTVQHDSRKPLQNRPQVFNVLPAEQAEFLLAEGGGGVFNSLLAIPVS